MPGPVPFEGVVNITIDQAELERRIEADIPIGHHRRKLAEWREKDNERLRAVSAQIAKLRLELKELRKVMWMAERKVRHEQKRIIRWKRLLVPHVDPVMFKDKITIRKIAIKQQMQREAMLAIATDFRKKWHIKDGERKDVV